MEMLFEHLTFVAHIIVVLLLYQHISGNKFKWYWFIIFPITFRILFLLVPPLAYFAYIFFLPVYSLYRNKYGSRLLDVFYSFYPIVVESLIGRVLAFYLFPILGFNQVMINTHYWINFIIEVSIYPLYFYFTKFVKIDFYNLQKGVKKNYLSRYFVLMNVSMFFYIILLQVLVIGEGFIPNAVEHREHLVGIYVVIFFVMLIYLNSTLTEKLELELLYQKNKQLEELSVYSKHVESLYNEIRSFRHDYINVLTSIQEGIELKDIEAIQEVYDNVLSKTKENFSNSKYDFANLSNITNTAIKSVVSAKLLEAQSKNVEVHVEVESLVSLSNMDALDIITILSILLDNAIEAACLAEKPCLTLAIFQEKDSDIIVVENSIREEKINISKIFDLGYSSKGENRGIGLSNVHDILDKYPAAFIKTSSRKHLFRQTIEIKRVC